MRSAYFLSPAARLAAIAALTLAFTGCRGEVTCASDRDCSGGGLVCATDRGVCVACRQDLDCLGGDQVCRANECVTVTPCASSRECPGLVCDTGRGFCVECVTDIDCPGEETCDPDGVCQAPPAACQSDAQCSAMSQVCDTAAMICVDCVHDADCVGGFSCVDRRCAAQPPLDGGADSGVRVDAGPPMDAGPLPDAGPPVDAGPRPDAGPPMDGGPGTDAGPIGTDAGPIGTDAGPIGTDAGPITDACAAAAAAGSTFGCRFWAVVTPSSALLPEHAFEVRVSNPGPSAATVTATRPGSNASISVPAGGSRLLALARDAALDRRDGDGSVLARGLAYRIDSNVPVEVFQILGARSEIPMDCAAEDGVPDNVCLSNTSDGSRLLPQHRLGTRYTVVARPSATIFYEDIEGAGANDTYFGGPGFFTVVATSATTVTVNSRAHTLASTDGSITAMTPGTNRTFTLGAGDVLTIESDEVQSCPPGAPSDDQLGGFFGTDVVGRYHYCLQGRSYDLSGTTVTATAPIQVIGGHDCTFVPYDRWACDHLESSLLPDARLGRDYVAARVPPITNEPTVLRLVSPTGGNAVSFTPAVASGRTLAAGEIFEIEVRQDVRVQSSAPLAVTQFLVSGLYDGRTTTTNESDPSMVTLFPVTAGATELLADPPPTWTNTLLLYGPSGASVQVDGAPVTGWTAIAGTSYSTARVPVAFGHRRVTSSQPIGGLLIGRSPSASYAIPLSGRP